MLPPPASGLERDRSAGPSSRTRPALRKLRALATRATRRTRGLQDRLAHLLGSNEEHRDELLARMLERNAHEATSCWLQLGVSIGIAPLGLVVGFVAAGFNRVDATVLERDELSKNDSAIVTAAVSRHA